MLQPINWQCHVFCIPLIYFLSAASAHDYINDMMLTFSVCQTTSCTNLGIVDDIFGEREERFTFTLTRTPEQDSWLTFGPMITGEVIIIDDDGKCILLTIVQALIAT